MDEGTTMTPSSPCAKAFSSALSSTWPAMRGRTPRRANHASSAWPNMDPGADPASDLAALLFSLKVLQ
jgi:hypothetical protein